MGQYSDSVRTINDTVTGTQYTTRDAFDLAAPTGDASTVTHITLFHKFTFASAAEVEVLAPISALIQRLKLQIGGRTIVDYHSPLTAIVPQSIIGDALEVMLKKIGGQAFLYPYKNNTDTDVFSWIRIPVGIAFNGAQSKRVNLEIVYGGGSAATAIDSETTAWAGSATSAVSSTELQVICDYGVARESVVLGSSVQFIHAANGTQVVTIPGDATKGQMLGILIGNDTQADQFSNDGLRPNLGGFLNIPPQYIHFLNGDTTFGYDRPNTDSAEGTSATVNYMISPGCTWVNTYRITAGADVDVIVANGAEQTTRNYFPIYVNSLNAKDAPKVKQNVQTVSSVTSQTVKEAQGSQ